MGRVRPHAFSIALVALCGGYLAGVAHGNERSATLLAAFQAFCTLPIPSFEELDAKATGRQLRVKGDYDSERVRSKSWLVEAGGGDYQLVAVRTTGADGMQVDRCGILATEFIGDEIKTDLAKTFQLGSPLQQITAGGFHGRGSILFWKTIFGSQEMGITLSENDMMGTQVLIWHHFEKR